MRQSIGTMPRPHTATVVATGPVEEVRRAVSWSGAEVEAAGADETRVRIRAESAEDLDTVVAVLAARFEVSVEEPLDLRPRLAAVARRLRAPARA